MGNSSTGIARIAKMAGRARTLSGQAERLRSRDVQIRTSGLVGAGWRQQGSIELELAASGLLGNTRLGSVDINAAAARLSQMLAPMGKGHRPISGLFFLPSGLFQSRISSRASLRFDPAGNVVVDGGGDRTVQAASRSGRSATTYSSVELDQFERAVRAKVESLTGVGLLITVTMYIKLDGRGRLKADADREGSIGKVVFKVRSGSIISHTIEISDASASRSSLSARLGVLLEHIQPRGETLPDTVRMPAGSTVPSVPDTGFSAPTAFLDLSHADFEPQSPSLEDCQFVDICRVDAYEASMQDTRPIPIATEPDTLPITLAAGVLRGEGAVVSTATSDVEDASFGGAETLDHEQFFVHFGRPTDADLNLLSKIRLEIHSLDTQAQFYQFQGLQLFFTSHFLLLLDMNSGEVLEVSRQLVRKPSRQGEVAIIADRQGSIIAASKVVGENIEHIARLSRLAGREGLEVRRKLETEEPLKLEWEMARIGLRRSLSTNTARLMEDINRLIPRETMFDNQERTFELVFYLDSSFTLRAKLSTDQTPETIKIGTVSFNIYRGEFKDIDYHWQHTYGDHHTEEHQKIERVMRYSAASLHYNCALLDVQHSDREEIARRRARMIEQPYQSQRPRVVHQVENGGVLRREDAVPLRLPDGFAERGSDMSGGQQRLARRLEGGSAGTGLDIAGRTVLVGLDDMDAALGVAAAPMASGFFAGMRRLFGVTASRSIPKKRADIIWTPMSRSVGSQFQWMVPNELDGQDFGTYALKFKRRAQEEIIIGRARPETVIPPAYEGIHYERIHLNRKHNTRELRKALQKLSELHIKIVHVGDGSYQIYNIGRNEVVVDEVHIVNMGDYEPVQVLPNGFVKISVGKFSFILIDTD